MITRFGLIFLSVCHVVGIARSAPLENWHWRNPQTQGNPLYAVTYGSGRFVAAGDGGSIVTSTNGIDWDLSVVPSRDTFHAVGYGNGMFVAGTTTGAVFVSSTGYEWNKVGAGLPGNIVGITFSGSEFLAVTENGWLGRSSDALTWQTEVIGTGDPLTDIAYGDGTIVVTSANHLALRGRVSVLPRGETNWINDRLLTYELFGATWGAGKFVVVGRLAAVWASTNGVNWEPTNVRGSQSDSLYAATSGDAGYIVAGSMFFTSVDAYVWQYRFTTYPSYYTPRRAAFGNGLYVAVGDYGEILTSSNGASWTSQLIGPRDNLKGAAHINGYDIAVGTGSTVLKSSDGAHWVKGTAPVASATISGVTFGKGQYVAVTSDPVSRVLCSSNGVDWQVIDPGVTNGLLAVTFANDLFVAVGTGGHVLTSRDGKLWTKNYSSNVWMLLSAVTYGRGTFVAVGGGPPSGPSRVVYSTNGTNWSGVEPSFLGPLRTVAYANGIFVAAGALGALMYSTNGNNWTTLTSPRGAWDALAFGDGRFVMAGGTNSTPSVFSSTNGVDWRLEARNVSYSRINSLTFRDGRFLAVGTEGLILESDYVGFPRLTIDALSQNQQVGLCVLAEQGSSYRLQSTTNLHNAGWRDEMQIVGAADRMCVTQNVTSATQPRFFRVVSP